MIGGRAFALPLNLIAGAADMDYGRRALIIDNSDTGRAGAWFLDCLRGNGSAAVKYRDQALPEEPPWGAVIISGSERSVFEDTEWIAAQMEMVRRRAAEKLPVLGACFGHQLIFRALYGKDALVRRPVPEAGWVPVALGADPLFVGLPRVITPYNFHFDQVLPPAADWDILATSETCPVHAARHRRLPFLGLQFHAEITPAEGVLGYERGRASLEAHGVDVDAFLASPPKGPRHYPIIIKRFVTEALSRPGPEIP